jgi:hypothetical protein
MKCTMKAALALSFIGAATAASDPRREVIRFPFNMPKGQKPVGSFNFMANCYNFINAMSSADSNAHTLKCHADGKLCNVWANTLPEVIKAKHSGEALHNKALSFSHWCDAVRTAQDPKTMPVANFKAEKHAVAQKQHKAQHDEHKVETKVEVQQKAKVMLKAKVQQQEEAEHVKLANKAQKLREQAEEAKAKAAKAAQEAEDKKSVAEMMKELSEKAKKEVAERAKKSEAHGHKEALMAKSVTDSSDAKYQELVNKLEHKATVEAPKAAAAPKAEKTIQHHGWEGVLATEDKMEAEHRGVRGGDFVQKASSPTHSESRIGHFVEEIYDDVASLVHRVV